MIAYGWKRVLLLALNTGITEKNLVGSMIQCIFVPNPTDIGQPDDP